MRYIFKFPDIGEGLDEGIILEWHVAKGHNIKAGHTLVTMETDKVVAAIPSPKTGVIIELFGKVGEKIHVGAALAEIEVEGTSNEQSAANEIKEESAAVVGTMEMADNSMILSASKEGLFSESVAAAPMQKVLATPIVRTMAKDLNIDIHQIKGTGPGGRVVKDDLLRFSNTSAQNAQPAPTKVEHEALVEQQAVSQIRKTIAVNMLRSTQNTARMTVFEEIEISELDQIRRKYKKLFAKEDIKLTSLAFIVKAVVLSLKKYKSLNASMDLDNNNIFFKRYYNIGIAVDTPRGLMVPVIKHADNLTVKEIAAAIQQISAKALNGTITLDEIKDGTFTITNYGSLGGIFATPVINYPEAAILGVGRVTQQAIVKADQVDIGLMLPLSLSVDHRITDGGEAARFLTSVMGYLSDPFSLFMD